MTAATTLSFLNTGNPTGLKFAVEHAGMRCIFDFGLEHAPGRAPFSLGLRPRPGREVSDLVAVGSAPNLAGVYANDRWDARTAVFISHMHLDHTWLVRHLHPDVPLYYPAAMEPLRAAVDASGYLRWRDPAGTPVADRGRVTWGGIEVTFVAVDHDVPGATGFLIRTPDLSIAYTGDHRWHGLHPELTAGFAEAARGVDVLVQEAVNAGLDEPADPLHAPVAALSEQEVQDELARTLAASGGLVVVNPYPMNRERVSALAAAAAAAGRRLVMEPGDALIAGCPERLDLEAVRGDPASHLVQLSFDSLPDLLDLPRPPGSVYLHSNGYPLGPHDPAFGVLEAWARATGLNLLRIGTSGHSRPADIPRMAAAVRPGVVLPVHSRTPEAFHAPGIRCLLPQPLRGYTRDDLLAAAVMP